MYIITKCNQFQFHTSNWSKKIIIPSLPPSLKMQYLYGNRNGKAKITCRDIFATTFFPLNLFDVILRKQSRNNIMTNFIQLIFYKSHICFVSHFSHCEENIMILLSIFYYSIWIWIWKGKRDNDVQKIQPSPKGQTWSSVKSGLGVGKSFLPRYSFSLLRLRIWSLPITRDFFRGTSPRSKFWISKCQNQYYSER